MNKMENDKRVYPICKYCGNLIKDGKIWEKDVLEWFSPCMLFKNSRILFTPITKGYFRR